MSSVLYKAVVEATYSFQRQLLVLEEALPGEDARVVLHQAILDLRFKLSGNPYSTRSIQLDVPDAETRERIRILHEKAKSLGLPNLKEVSILDYVVQIAHSEKRVVMISICHKEH